MGGNGSFVRGNANCEDGRRWKTIAVNGRIHILEMKDQKKGNKLPEESHTPGRIYAMFRKDGKDVGSIAQYGKDGKKIWEIHTSPHHMGREHYHKWKDGKPVSSHYLTKALRRILNKVRRFEK